MPLPLPGSGVGQLSAPLRHGKDDSEEDFATIALRGALAYQSDSPEPGFEETLGILLALETSKQH